jgi:hypothetical protein
LGHKFRNAIELLDVPKDQQKRLNIASSELNQFWQAQRGFLSKIRNTLAAHREQDALGYIEALDQVKPLEVMARAADLSGRIDKLLNVINEIALSTSGPESILRDIVTSSKKQAGQQP